MLGHPDLIHAVLMLAYLGMLLLTAGNVRVPAMRNVSTLIQLTVLLLCVDLLIGFFAIEEFFDNRRAASWISKSIYGLPVLFFIALWWQWRSRRSKNRD